MERWKEETNRNKTLENSENHGEIFTHDDDVHADDEDDENENSPKKDGVKTTDNKKMISKSKNPKKVYSKKGFCFFSIYSVIG